MDNKEIKKQLEKQVELLSELSQTVDLKVEERLAISAEVRAICYQLFEFQNVRWVHDEKADFWSAY